MLSPLRIESVFAVINHSSLGSVEGVFFYNVVKILSTFANIFIITLLCFHTVFEKDKLLVGWVIICTFAIGMISGQFRHLSMIIPFCLPLVLDIQKSNRFRLLFLLSIGGFMVIFILNMIN